MRRYISSLFLALVVGFLSFAGVSVAFAAGENVSEATEMPLLEMAKPILDAVRGGQGVLAAALALVFCVSLARRYGGKRFPFLMSDAGGSALTLLGGFGGALATALMAGTVPSFGLAMTALGVAFAAAGGYTMIKRLAVPAMRAMQAKLPTWAQPILGLVLWIFDKPSAVAKAESAGAAAVAAKPGPGIEGVAGAPKEFP